MDGNAQKNEKSSFSPLPLFEQSTQYKHWRFSPAGLTKLRRDLNEGAVKRVAEMQEKERAEVASEHGGTNPDSLPLSSIEYLSPLDEMELVYFYLTKVVEICNAFKYPESVKATTMSYVKRFYLKNTCMDYHPKDAMLTCLFLATKTENHVIPIDSLSQKVKTEPSKILDLEFLVSQSLSFQFKVHHAHIAAEGIWLDMHIMGEPSLPPTALLRAHVQSHIASSRLTDAEFLYTPSQIALAAFWIEDKARTRQWLEVKSQLKSEAGPQMATTKLDLDPVTAVLEKIAALILEQEARGIDIQAVKEIDRRLKFCANPEKNPDSALYKKRQAGNAEDSAAKRESKIKNANLNSSGDVFS